MEIVTGNISFVQDNKIPNKSKSQNLKISSPKVVAVAVAVEMH